MQQAHVRKKLDVIPFSSFIVYYSFGKQNRPFVFVEEDFAFSSLPWKNRANQAEMDPIVFFPRVFNSYREFQRSVQY